MAAAYAALVSLRHFTEQIELHPRHPISLDAQLIDSLTRNVDVLHEYLESYSSSVGYGEEARALENRIADAAHGAEDAIESHIVDRILAGRSGDRVNPVEFRRSLEDVIESMELIHKEAMQVKRNLGEMRRSFSIRSANTEQRLVTEGFDDELYELLDKLTGGDFQIVSIVGMGGIGKSTLARKVFENQLIAYHFDILAWITVTQEYSVKALLELLCAKLIKLIDREILDEMSEDELGEKLYTSLWKERYLIVMDDVWDIEVLNQLKLFFPNNRNGRRIMITTRLSNLEFHQSKSYKVKVKFLDESASWNLLSRTVFGGRNCPLELVEIGKRIAKNCSGLPLSIVVFGGLLAKSEQTQDYWEYILKDLNSIVNSEDGDRCLKILHLSYSQLPLYLKPCFLYTAVFPEGCTIRVSTLVNLLVGEGFLKPISGKSHEDVAEEYVKELIDRNLILVHSCSYDGKVKECRMHDLLRDLCLKEVEKHKFFCLLTEHNLGIPEIPEEMNCERRIVINKQTSKDDIFPDQVFHALGSAKFARSLISEFQEPLPSFNLKLLRVCSLVDENYPDTIFKQVNLRYLSLDLTDNAWNLLPGSIPSSISLLWNLQTLIWVANAIVPSEIWKMPLLKHVIFSRAELPDPPLDDEIVLENLQTLVKIHNFKISEDVVMRIPNIKKLKLCYEDFIEGSSSCIKNLAHLHQLEWLGIVIDPFPNVEKTRMHLMENLTFPRSLKKLTIGLIRFHWEDLTTKIGSLPLLEVLKLKWKSFIGPEWETVERNFRSLKFLLVEFCDLECWKMESFHFPRLEQIVLRDLPLLKEIDSRIGDIPTLVLIELESCNISVAISAKRLVDEQEKLGNDGLQVRVLLSRKNKVLESLASPNFQVKTWTKTCVRRRHRAAGPKVSIFIQKSVNLYE